MKQLVVSICLLLVSLVVLGCGNRGLSNVSNATGMVQGRVVDSVTHTGISGATVACGTLSTVTNTYGAYTIGMPSGRATVTVAKVGYQPQMQDVNVESNMTKPLNFDLVEESQNTGTVQGTVYDSGSRNPIERVHITFAAGGWTYAVDSGLQGGYSIELPSSSLPGITYSVTATAKGYRPFSGSVTVRTGTFNNNGIAMTR